MVFNHEWWFESDYRNRIEEAKRRCAIARFHQGSATAKDPEEARARFLRELETRTIVYLRDGFSYEVKELIPQKSTSTLTFECTPSDEAYRVGAFVVTVPFDDIVRVEIFAVHPTQKPEDMPSIKGFSGSQAPPLVKRAEERPPRSEG